MKLFQWRGRVSRKEFRKEFLAAVIKAAPHVRCAEVADDELAFRIEGLDEYKEVNVSLQRAYAEFEQDPGERERIMERWLRATEHVWLPERALDPADVVPMIKQRAWLEAQWPPGQPAPARDSPDSFWYEDLNAELIVVYAVHRNGFAYSQRSELAAAGVTEQNIRSLALENLRRLTPEREFSTVNGIWMIMAGGNFESSLLVDDSVWNDSRFAGGTLLVAAPERDGLFATTSDSADAVWNLASMASHGVRTQPYPISSRLFVRAGDRFELLDPEDHDDEHPIPALDVLDIEATGKDGTSRFVIVIATPLARDSRSVFRLFRKIDGYLAHFAATKRAKEATELEISIHPGTDRAIFALLAALPEYIASRGARLVVERRK